MTAEVCQPDASTRRGEALDAERRWWRALGHDLRHAPKYGHVFADASPHAASWAYARAEDYGRAARAAYACRRSSIMSYADSCPVRPPGSPYSDDADGHLWGDNGGACRG